MIVVPTDRKILLYGPAMVNVESEVVDTRTGDEVGRLPELRDYMVSMMKGFNAIGLASPQIGVFKQFIVFEREGGEIVDMVNPEIVGMVGKEILGIEACLSVPPSNNECLVPRMERITVEYSTSEVPQLRRCTELRMRDAVVVQHEVDHLTGTFFFDRVSGGMKMKILESFHKWKKENPTHVKGNSRSLSLHRF